MPEGGELTLGHPGSLLSLLTLLNGALEVLDLIPQPVGISSNLHARLLKSGNDVILSLDSSLSSLNLLLDVILCSLQAVGFVNDVLDSRASRVESKSQFILLIGEFVVFCNNGIALCHSLVDISLSNGNLFFILSLVLAELGALKVGLNGHPDLPPQPGLANVVVSDCSLAAVESKLLILELLELHTGSLASGSSLQPGKNLTNSVLSHLLHESKDTSSEEDLGVAKTEFLLV